MSRSFIIPALGLLGFALGGCAIFGHDELHYSHAVHLSQAVGCLECHTALDRDPRTDLRHKPNHVQCGKCHDVKKETGCTLCHTNAAAAANKGIEEAFKPFEELIFDHPQHMPATRGNCVRCHNAVPNSTSPTEAMGMEMATCATACHGDWLKQLRCGNCHSDLKRYRIENIRLITHTAGFEHRHGDQAHQNRDTCNQCHDRSFCSDCHSNTSPVPMTTRMPERTTASFIHPTPYVSLHAFDARTGRDNCSGCHRPTFCESCHSTVGLASVQPLNGAPHPRGWLDPMSPVFHGMEARRSIASCAACHDQGAASVCVRCHQVGGQGGNPHPPGFRAGKNDSPTTQRMCRACHTTTPAP